QAVAAQQDGKLKEAEKLYRSILENQPLNYAARNNFGVLLRRLGRYEEAEANVKKAIEIKPDYADAYNNLGNILKSYGKFDRADEKFRKAIEHKSNYVQAHCNLGATLNILNRLEEALESLNKAIKLKPDHTLAYFNLGNTFYDLGRLEKAEENFKIAIKINPSYYKAHNNLGNTYNYKGNLEAAINSFKKVLNIKPDYSETWNNIYFPLQAIKLQTSSIEKYLPFFDDQVKDQYIKIEKSILNYSLNLGNPSADNYLNKVYNMLSSVENIAIKNPNIISNEIIKPTLQNKITALVHFGRSGTGLLHSLIDGHNEVSTLPSVYLSEFFDYFTWKKIIAGGWEEMADRFTTIYPVLF
ncbi:tetratricopeptide repeat protein, partial [Pelagibacterales bacterium SAG-MED44]|nr:tetratricopeptide repeat protein [Pelagibacterales bacterium SAG-MED44]